MLVAYASQALVYPVFLRRELSISLADLIRQLWPVVPAMLAGYGASYFLFHSPSDSLFMLAYRGMFTAAVVALTHGALTRFRCFQEAWELTCQKFAGSILKEKLAAPDDNEPVHAGQLF